MSEILTQPNGPWVAEFCGFGVPGIDEHSWKSVKGWEAMAAELTNSNRGPVIDSAIFEQRTKAQVIADMDRASLPRAESVWPPSRQEFFENPKYWLEKITSPLISARFSDSQQRVARQTIIGGRQDVLEELPQVDEIYDEVLLRENYVPLLSGTVVIEDQDVYMEAALGYLGRVIHDGQVEFAMQTDPFTRCATYEVRDPVARLDGTYYSTGDYPPESICRQLSNVLLSIPYLPDGRDGYYEFSLIDKIGQGHIEPVFWDYNKNRYFRNVL
jgi:hypothetical protein